MAKLIGYSEDKEWAYYDDGNIAHRHKLDPNSPDNPLKCKQAYYQVINDKCSKCGQKSIKKK
jgi:hypothetical protein